MLVYLPANLADLFEEGADMIGVDYEQRELDRHAAVYEIADGLLPGVLDAMCACLRRGVMALEGDGAGR